MGRIIYSPGENKPPHECEASIPDDVFIHAGSIYECDCGKWLHCYYSSRRSPFDQSKWSPPDFYAMSWGQKFMARLIGKVKVDDLNNPKAVPYKQPPKRTPPRGDGGQGTPNKGQSS